MLKLIICVDANNGIGLNNKLPWNIKSEMQHFKNTTINHTIVMGRKTYESIGRLLPSRNNIIFSKQKNYKVEGAIVTNDVKKILELAKTENVFIIGGKSIYDLFINYCDELIISQLPVSYDCDTFVKLNLKFFKLENIKSFAEFKVMYYKSLGNKILSGKMVSEHMKIELMERKKKLFNKYKILPQLAIVQVGSEFASSVYIRNKIKLGEEIGISVKHIQLGDCKEDRLLAELNKLNNDKSIHGILIQLPLPKTFDTNIIFNTISPIKDVDCFNPQNVGKLFINPFADDINILPCTPHGIIKLLEFYNIKIESQNIAIIGRSNIVGKPLVSLLLNKNATVKICHSKTKNLTEECQWADILIVAIGQPKMVNANYLKHGAVVIDVGINQDDNNKLCGDVDFEDVIDKVSYISPVPFGIGPMTLIMLFNNLLNVYLKSMQMI